MYICMYIYIYIYTICASYYYMCPRTTIYKGEPVASVEEDIYVLIILYVHHTTICVFMLLCVFSYYYIYV